MVACDRMGRVWYDVMETGYAFSNNISGVLPPEKGASLCIFRAISDFRVQGLKLVKHH